MYINKQLYELRYALWQETWLKSIYNNVGTDLLYSRVYLHFMQHNICDRASTALLRICLFKLRLQLFTYVLKIKRQYSRIKYSFVIA